MRLTLAAKLYLDLPVVQNRKRVVKPTSSESIILGQSHGIHPTRSSFNRQYDRILTSSEIAEALEQLN